MQYKQLQKLWLQVFGNRQELFVDKINLYLKLYFVQADVFHIS